MKATPENTISMFPADADSENPAPSAEHTIEACQAEMRDWGLSIARAAAEMGKGVSQATLSQWLRGRYQGDVDAVTRRVARWLTTRAEGRVHGLDASGLGKHVGLGVTEEIEAALGYAHAAGDLCLIHGRSGLGKSWNATRYCATHSQAFRLQCTPAMTTPAGLLMRLAQAVGIGGRYASAIAAETAVIEAVAARGALLVVDEAHHLKVPLLDELRCIRDIAGCGLAYIGSDDLWTTLQASNSCDQIIGRIGIRLPLGSSSEADSSDLSEVALGRPPTKAEAKILSAAVRGRGGMHALHRLLTRAWVSCRAEGRNHIDAQDIRIAADAA